MRIVQGKIAIITGGALGIGRATSLLLAKKEGAKIIAYGVLYLASDESKFVMGSELVIDGGYTAQ